MLSDRYISILTTVGIYAGLPAIAAEFLIPYGFDKINVIVYGSIILWMFHTEFRIRELHPHKKRRRKGR